MTKSTKRNLRQTTTLYGAASVGIKGQVVIPVKLRKAFNIKSNDVLMFVSTPAHPRGVMAMAKVDTMMHLSQGLNEIHRSLRSFIVSKKLNKKSNRT